MTLLFSRGRLAGARQLRDQLGPWSGPPPSFRAQDALETEGRLWSCSLTGTGSAEQGASGVLDLGALLASGWDALVPTQSAFVLISESLASQTMRHRAALGVRTEGRMCRAWTQISREPSGSPIPRRRSAPVRGPWSTRSSAPPSPCLSASSCHA